MTPDQRQRFHWLRKPSNLIQQTRWIFCGCAFLALALTTIGPLLASEGAAGVALVLVATSLLTCSWAWRYRTGNAPIALDVLDALATGAFAAACPDPAMAFGFVFSASWLRVLFGTTPQVAFYSVAVVTSMAAAVPLWPLVPGHVGSPDAGGALGALPVLFLTIIVARYLATILFTHEQSQDRDAALLMLGSRLLGVTDRAEVLRLAWTTIEQVCRCTPGLRVLAVREQAADLQVIAWAGDFPRRPSTLPTGLLPASAAPGPVDAVADATSLNESAGISGTWIAMSMPGQSGDVVVLGFPKKVSQEAVVAVQSLMNQVAMALNACDAHAELWTQARTDHLTGLANRTAFSSALASQLAGAGHVVTLLLLDLDDFKAVNDTFGHTTGDELLRHVARRLRATIRPDDVCARLGGDEFAVVFADAAVQVVDTVAQRLVTQISAPIELSGQRVQIGVSIGVARSTPDLNVQELVRRADLAMYEAKRRGKNRVEVFDAELPHPRAVFVATQP